MLTKGTPVNDGATLLYSASKYDRDACWLKARCCPPLRPIARWNLSRLESGLD